MTEYDHEPIRGLPGDLPPGESILWQGAPTWRSFYRHGLHARAAGLYFAALALLAMAGGNLIGALAIVVTGMLLQGLLASFAMAVARTTVYTLTNRRVVLRVGVALNKCINLPLGLIAAADLRAAKDGTGDIALTLVGRHRLGYAMLWPHARPWRLSRPQPMLRALPDAQAAAEALARACAAVVPNATPARTAPARSAPQRGDEALQGAVA